VPALSPRQTNRPVEDIEDDLMPSVGGGKEKRLLTERLGIEEQAVHVEDDGGGHPGKFHVYLLIRCA
jgi:hypothetical protein